MKNIETKLDKNKPDEIQLLSTKTDSNVQTVFPFRESYLEYVVNLNE